MKIGTLLVRDKRTENLSSRRLRQLITRTIFKHFISFLENDVHRRIMRGIKCRA